MTKLSSIRKPAKSSLLSWHGGSGRPGGVTAGQSIGLSLSNLIVLRWIAVAGQFITLMVVQFGFGFDIAIMPCLVAVGALAASNLTLMTSRHRRLREAKAARVLAFDLLQMASLIGLTGGLQNPFALLMLAPVTVSATILSRKSTIWLTSLAVVIATLVAYFHLPLPWETPGGGDLPVIYRLGIWTALTMSIVFIGTFVWTVSDDSRRLSNALSESADALARVREMSSLGALAAAAAHELGSPLATIAVVSKELLSSVDKSSPIYEDIELLKSQSDRCRDILVSLSRRPGDAPTDPFDTMALSNLTELAVDEHVPDEIDLSIVIDEDCEGPEPQVQRTPEFLNGLGNFASNAGQFAKTSVTVTLSWNRDDVWITILDDGPGFSSSALHSLGEPYMSTRSGKDGHMGLGIFIATTLLERIGAETRFRNRRGAEIQIHWPRRVLEGGAERL